jgi:hypothetical protein
MTEIDYALSQTKDTDIIELVGTVVWNKAKERNSFENLSQAERNFIYIDIFESEINNQGLYGFFYNTSGEFAHEVLQAFIDVKATETSDIVDKALRVFPELPVPKDILMRRQLMGKLKASDLDFWSDLELDLVNANEAIVDLVIDYIRLHKTKFEY